MSLDPIMTVLLIVKPVYKRKSGHLGPQNWNNSSMRLFIPIGIVLLPTGKGNIVPPVIENEIAKPIGADISIKPVTWTPIGADDEDTDVGQFNPDPTIMSPTSEPVTIHTGIEDLFGDDIDLVSLWDEFDESKIPTLEQCLIGDNDEEFEEPEIKEVDFEKDSIEVLKSSQVVLGSLLPVEMFKDTPEPRLALGLMNQDEINQAVPDNLVKPTKFPISLNTISLHTLQTVKTTQSPTIEPLKDMLCLAEPSQEVIDISAIDSSDSIVSDELDKESFFQNSKYLLIF